jgi:hypothetical protein
MSAQLPSSERSSPTECLDARLAAAHARAAGLLPTSARGLLARQPAQVWRVVEVGDHVLLSVAADFQLHRVDRGELPIARLTPTQALALLGVLVATSTGASHPWPGRPARVADVLAGLGGPDLPDGRVANLRGALKRLHSFRLAVVGASELREPASVHDEATVTVGPAVAAWAGPWVDDLMALVSRVAAMHPIPSDFRPPTSGGVEHERRWAVRRAV